MPSNRGPARNPNPRARKRLSQNFLTDPTTARMIVRTATVAHDDLVLEIGPGDGMLTRQLIGATCRLRAYEADPHYAGLLAERYRGEPRIHVMHQDFRTVTAPNEPFSVVANAPFAITTDIVRFCLAAAHLTSATLLTQLEFARKHSGNYGRWSKLAVLHWPTTAISMGARIDRGKFFPIPRVDGALLRIERRREPLLPQHHQARYRRLVTLGFSGIGGSLASSLAKEHPVRTVRAACTAAGVSTDQPVGLVAPDRWLRLYRTLSSHQ